MTGEARIERCRGGAIALAGARASGLVLLVAGVVKLLPDDDGARGTWPAVIPPEWLIAAAVAECVVGAGVVVRPSSHAVRLSGLALTLLLTLGLLVLVVRGVPIERCGCFGRLTAFIGGWHFAINAFVLAGISFGELSCDGGAPATQ